MNTTATQEADYQNLFFTIMSLGFSCGMTHPIECYGYYVNHLPQFVSYADVPESFQEATEAMAYFFRESVCCPEEADEFQQLTDQELLIKVTMWYNELNQEEVERHERSPRDPSIDCKV